MIDNSDLNALLTQELPGTLPPVPDLSFGWRVRTFFELCWWSVKAHWKWRNCPTCEKWPHNPWDCWKIAFRTGRLSPAAT